MTNFRRTSQGVNDVQFANPADLTHRVRVVVKTSKKQVGQFQRTNIRSELISNSNSGVDVGENCCGPSAYDATSVRTSISGSLENKDHVLAQVRQHIASLEKVAADITNGFVPYDAVLEILDESPAV